MFKLSNGITNLEIVCNTKNENLDLFTITSENKKSELILRLENPFAEKSRKKNVISLDTRVPYLIKIIEKVLTNNWINYSFLERHVKLWGKIKDMR